MLVWTQHLFLFLNASADPYPWMVQASVALTDSPTIVVPAFLVALWVWGTPSRRGGLLAVAGAILVGQGVNQLVGLFVFEPRPFMVPVGHTLIPHAADNGFPSDHATFALTLGAGLALAGAARGWVAGAACVYGVGVAWSRVYLGVHFPGDVAASALVAIACGGLARAALLPTRAWLLPWAERLYQAVLPAFHLPPAVIPRAVSVDARDTRRQTVR